ncbi:tripartite tricarboxylate transporter substrate-binding protein [Muricoccus aerilatus]|uniref:tripartite tricarboxylate transporter substrate-binding protein n=1 Tax=Muricoccus aerilatus TaxID=452982 RepID=UPI0005C169AD|nr:tripartite tricarboxylate transporter substrate-binding protein [Roseomonas aerilata]
MLMRRRLAAVAAAGIITARAAPAGAQPAWPTRPVRLLVGSTPGGSADIGARIVSARLAARIGQPVVVENKPGATGLIAAAEVARAAPDGHTLLFTASWHSTAAAMRTALPFDPLGDFSFLSTLVTYGMMLAVRPSSPYARLEDLLAAARARPGTLSYYSVGIGSGHHLIGEWLLGATGVEMVHVPYRGSAAALPDFMAGRVDLMIDTMTIAFEMARKETIRPLAITSTAPMPELPGVRLASEIVPGFSYESWLGLMGPGGMPGSLMHRLSEEIRLIVAMPDVDARLREMGAVPAASTPEAFHARVAGEIASFNRVVETRRLPRE